MTIILLEEKQFVLKSKHANNQCSYKEIKTKVTDHIYLACPEEQDIMFLSTVTDWINYTAILYITDNNFSQQEIKIVVKS